MAVDGWAGGRHAPRGAGLGALPATLWGRMLLQGATCSASTEAKVQQIQNTRAHVMQRLNFVCRIAHIVLDGSRPRWRSWHCAGGLFRAFLVALGGVCAPQLLHDAPLASSGKPHEPLNSSGGAVPSIRQFCHVITVSVPPMWCSLTGAWNPARDSMQLTDASAIRRKSTPNIWATRPAESPRRQWATTDTFASESFSPWLCEASA